MSVMTIQPEDWKSLRIMKNLILYSLGLLVVSGHSRGAFLLDFNSNQPVVGGVNQGGTPAPGDPANGASSLHNEAGYQSYHVTHEVAAEFVTANYHVSFMLSGATSVSLTPTWPSTSANTVMQMIGRTDGQAATWVGEKGNLLRDWIGIDSRTTAPGGLGPWDGVTVNPTYMHLTLGGLPSATYAMRTYHHDVENMNSFFTLEISTDGGATFGSIISGRMTNSTTGGSPAENEIFGGTAPNVPGGDPADLSSTLNFNFAADGTNPVVLRFAPLGPALMPVHQTFFGINGFELDQVPEPSSAVLVLGGLAGVLLRRRR